MANAKEVKYKDSLDESSSKSEEGTSFYQFPKSPVRKPKSLSLSKSSKRHDKHHESSRRSHKSNRSSISRADVKRKQLLVAQETLKKRQVLEQKRLHLQQEEERLDFETEMQLNLLDLENESCSSRGTNSTKSKAELSIDLSEDDDEHKVRKWLAPQHNSSLDAQVGSEEFAIPEIKHEMISPSLDVQVGSEKFTPPEIKYEINTSFSADSLDVPVSPALLGNKETLQRLTPPDKAQVQEGPPHDVRVYSRTLNKSTPQQLTHQQPCAAQIGPPQAELVHSAPVGLHVQPSSQKPMYPQYVDIGQTRSPPPVAQASVNYTPIYHGMPQPSLSNFQYLNPGIPSPVQPASHVDTSQVTTQDPGTKSIIDLVKEQGSLTKLLLEQHTRALLPQRSITPFSGDALEYVSFMHTFEHNIERKLSEEKEKYYFLEYFTTGDANRVVKSCMRMEQPFIKAKELLKKKFGDGYKVAQAFVNKAVSWPDVKADDASELNKLSFFLMECNNVLGDINYTYELNHTANIKAIVKKLPYRLRDRWRITVDNIIERKQRVDFTDLVTFIEQQARIMNSVYGDVVAPKDKKEKEANMSRFGKSRNKASFATRATATGKPDETPVTDRMCLYCNGKNHDLSVCRKLQSEPNNKRIDFIKSKNLCFGCLKKGSHISKNCTKRLECKTCKMKHPTVLHRETTQSTKDTESKQDVEPQKQEEIRSASSKCMMSTGAGTPALVPVKVRSRKSGITVTTYAFLDDGSNAVFCSEGLRSQLKVTGKHTKLQIHTLLEDQEVDSQVLSDLEIMDLEGRTTIELPQVYTQDKMPVSLSDVITSEDIKQWPYLNHIKLNDMRKEAKEVGLLIGSNVPKATEPWEVVHSQDDGPYAYRTVLGWIVAGIKLKAPIISNRIHVKADLHQQLVNMFNHEFNERTVDDVPERSREDQQFMESVSSTINHKDGHYEIGLPLKNQSVNMPNNRARAEERAAHLKVKFKKNPEFFKEYSDFMTDMMNNEYAEKVPQDTSSMNSDGRKWYIPHHGVFHPQKQKLRIVFDCSARYSGTSLNDHLLQGPDLTSTLFGVLTRFREDCVALMADIRSMFYQVRVPECDRDLLRFLWWPQADIQKPLEEYRMKVHLFGATSSPACANFALRTTAKEAESRYEQKVIDTVNRNFYVDDCLVSVSDEQEAIKLSKDLGKLCEEGGFELTKWSSNRRAVIQSIPESKRSKEVTALDLEIEDLPSEKALGMLWFPEEDQFGYKIAIKERPKTRRGILSTMSSVYDPLGFIGPVVLTAKQTLQDLCRLQLGWDDPIPDHHSAQWQDWLANLPRLSDFKVERCLKPKDYGQPDKVEIHHFCDASNSGYGTVSYLRMKNNNGIHCAFLTSKARVAPLKQVTIPRLELTAAAVAVRMNHMLLKELQIPVNNVHYWTDSMSVLQYIQNETARFHTFVANRVNLIREGSTPDQWHYVKSEDNPADDCSRGLPVAKFLKCERWLKGPLFLWKEECEWPEVKVERSEEYLLADPEVKVTATVVQDQEQESEDSTCIDKLLNHFSSWHDLKKAVGWILRVRKYLLQKVKARKQEAVNDKDTTTKTTMNAKEPVKIVDRLTVEELQMAENAVIKYVQQKSFTEEIKLLNASKEDKHNDHHVKRTSPLYRLDPRITDGILRVGGRLNKAAMPEERKHPAILPKKEHLTDLILRHIHESSGHSGRNYMLSQARKKYWIINANSKARNIISKCVVCRRQRSRMEEQKMADLPKARVTPGDPPFSKIGMDYFGPIEVKQGRSKVKRYGVVFTCLTIRAVHIEKADTLDTDSTINAIRRFVARRGPVQQIVSDNGTNLVGAERELRKHIDQWNQSKIHESLLQDGIEWVFNPPTGSHFGGVWERQIKTIRRVMNSILKEQTLTDESLQTLFCECESIINNRPITCVPEEPGDLEALTPNHLLLLKVKPVLSPTAAEETGPYVRKRWKQIQYMTDLFWKRWSKEYITQLQERQKWVRPKPNVKVGNIVLIANESVPRNQWLMARVIETLPDHNGYVRQVKLQTKTSILLRPVHKLILLLEADE